MRDLLRNPAFARLFLGRLVTNAGDSLYTVAAMWLVYSLSGSTLYTGIAGFLTMAPQALGFLVGPLVDRWPARRVLVGSQAAQAVLVLAIPAAAALDALTVWVVLAIMPALAMLNQFVYPAQHAVLPRVVDRESLTAANTAFSFALQGSNLAFNAAAGLLIALVGGVALYLIDSLTFLAAALLFVGLRVPPADGIEDEADFGYLGRLRGGLGFVRGSVVLPLLGTGLFANALLGATWPVLPAFADARAGPELYGLLLAAVAAGSLGGSALAARLGSVPFGRLAIVGFALGAVAWFGAVFAPWTPLAVALFALAFVPVGVTNVAAMTLVQRLVPETLLGRVTAVVGSASAAVMPLGALAGGAAADAVGPVAVMAVGGLGFLWIVVYVAAIPTLRRLPPTDSVEPLEEPAPALAAD